MTKNSVGWILAGLLAIGMFATAYSLGRRSERKVIWFSELTEKTVGRKTFILDTEVVCQNGKDLGRLQVDLNLENGKLRIVRNDSQLFPNCAK